MRAPMRCAGGAVVAMMLATALAACAGFSGSSGSRHTLYESIDALAADSSVIVVGTVAEQRGDDTTTISTTEVGNAPANPQLGANLDGDHAPVVVGDVVGVRQDIAPFLAPGSEYLLFLTLTMLPGAAASQYYITGAVAGLYQREGDEFRRIVADSGDALPDTITVAY